MPEWFPYSYDCWLPLSRKLFMKRTPRTIGWWCPVRFPKPYSTPKSATFPTIFMTCPEIWYPTLKLIPFFRPTLQSQVKAWLKAFVDGFINIDEKEACPRPPPPSAEKKKNRTNSRLECENHILFETKMAKTDALGWKNLELLIYYKELVLRLTVCCI